MSNYNEIRVGLGAAMQRYEAGLNIYYHVPRTLVPPAAIIEPNSNRSIDYTQAYSSGLADWHFVVTLVIGLVDEEASQRIAGDLISPGSSLLETLNNSSRFAKVTQGSVAEATFGKGLYTCARLSVLVKA